MKERPILFSAPMVRAILAGTKTQTRRAAKGRALEWLAPGMFTPAFVADPANDMCPYGQPGDRLWVREAFAHWTTRELFSGRPMEVTSYRAGRFMLRLPEGAPPSLPFEQWERFWDDDLKPEDVRWRPSIHMPRALSRILLEITDVRVQRLQDISGSDARAEGVERIHCYGPDCPDGEDGCNARGCYGARERFHELWDSINGAGAWDANPWVWAVSFNRMGS